MLLIVDSEYAASVIKSPVSHTPSLRGTEQSWEQCSELWIASQARKDEIGDWMTEAEYAYTQDRHNGQGER